MPDMPKVKPRNMADQVKDVVGTHALIAQGIQERAKEHAKHHAAHNQKLNSESAVTRQSK